MSRERQEAEILISGGVLGAEVDQLISAARRAEACRDIDLLGEILSPVLPDVESDPVVPDVGAAQRGEILRLCGFFLGYYGNAASKANYQERGKDLLSRAIDLFESEGLEEEAGEARLNLAWRYLQQGAHAEAAAIVEYTKERFGKRRSSPIFLRLKLFESVAASAAGEFDRAAKIISALAPAIDKCDDSGICGQYHIEAGYVNTELGNYPAALEHYNHAETYARLLENERFLAIILGNIAFVLLKQRHYGRSLKRIEAAIELNRKNGRKGFLAHNFDTKAQILLAEGEAGRALLAIDQSLELFRTGEDTAGLCEAQFNKIRILLKLQEIEEALMLFAELVQTARTNITETSARKFADRFSDLVFYPESRGYKEEVSEFKKYLLKESLTSSGNVMKDAAESLDISQAMLSDILRRQFPEIFDELNIKKRKSRKKG